MNISKSKSNFNNAGGTFILFNILVLLAYFIVYKE